MSQVKCDTSGTGRLVSATILTLFLLPVIYQAFTPVNKLKMNSERPLP